MGFNSWSTCSTSSYCPFRYYKILERLGSGAFGTVYLCKLRDDDRLVAMKKISKHKGCEEDYMEEFENFSNIRHARLVRYLAYFTSRRYYNLVLEYAPNGTLEHEIQSRRYYLEFWNEDEILEMFVDMLIGVEYLHKRGFIHRDLKPDNVLVGRDFRLKLSDFGLAKVMDRTGYQYLYASKIGARCYAAPELIARKPYYNEKVDVWSLGVILHEMCRLKHPFFGRYPTPNVPYLHSYSEEFNELVNSMLVRSRHERASIEDIVYEDIVYCVYCYQI